MAGMYPVISSEVIRLIYAFISKSGSVRTSMHMCWIVIAMCWGKAWNVMGLSNWLD